MQMNTDIKSCVRCKFYYGNDYEGKCRRRAPFTVIPLSTIPDQNYYRIGTIWPSVGNSDWCGEFEREKEVEGGEK